jgi:hypothetical protein
MQRPHRNSAPGINNFSKHHSKTVPLLPPFNSRSVGTKHRTSPHHFSNRTPTQHSASPRTSSSIGPRATQPSSPRLRTGIFIVSQTRTTSAIISSKLGRQTMSPNGSPDQQLTQQQELPAKSSIPQRITTHRRHQNNTRFKPIARFYVYMA